ncbi:MAG: J domain-containing protein [Deltaproteobacteria bacterium]|nr:J domain-containing protein [Deltaproteobacteria bacterium]
MSPRDLYAVLGVPRTASADEVKKAYRKLAKANHPDRNPGDAKAEERFKQASAAFDVLGDAEKRKLYDEFGEDSLRSGFDPAQARKYRGWQQDAARAARASYQARGGGTGPGGIDLDELLRSSGRGADTGGFSFSDLGDALGDLFGMGGGGRERKRPAGPTRGEDVDTQIQIDLERAVLGGKTKIRVARPDRPRPQQLTVTIPSGIEDGKKIRLSGQGQASPDGGKPGDLLITVRIRPHEHFRREGDDLLLSLPVTVGEAMRGATVEVPTLEGSVKLKIPAGSQSGSRLRLKGKGVPTRKDRPAGNLTVELVIEVPRPGKLGEELEAALDTLEAAYTHRPRAGLKKS